MQVSPCRAPNAGLLTAGAMFAYSAMLLWGALSDEPPDDLCSMHNSSGSNDLKVRSAPSQCSGTEVPSLRVLHSTI